MKNILSILSVVILLLLAGCATKSNFKEPTTIDSPMLSEKPEVVIEVGPETADDEDSDIGQQDTVQETPSETTALEDENKNIVDLNTPHFPELSSDIKSLIESKLSGPHRVVVMPGSVTAKAGDNIVFGLGIYNADTKARTFKASVFHFKDATDASNNAIKADESTLENWLLTKFEAVSIAPYGTEITPFYLNIGQINDGVDVKPGVYRFELVVNEVDKYGILDKYGDVDIFVKVIE